MRKIIIGFLLFAFMISTLIIGLTVDEVAYTMGFLFGISLVLMIAYIVSLFQKTKRVYDERQMLVRGKCYKYSFFVMVVLLLTDFVGRSCDINVSILPEVSGMIVLYGGIGTFVIMSIINDAYDTYVGINSRKLGLGFMMLVITALFMFMGISNCLSNKVITDNALNMNIIPLFSGIFFMIFSIVYFGKYIYDIRQKNEES